MEVHAIPDPPTTGFGRNICKTLYTALCMATGKMTSLILPYANTEMMNLFLEQVAQDFKEFFVIMLIDQAGWHMAKKLNIPGCSASRHSA
jgi:hypothetical protein